MNASKVSHSAVEHTWEWHAEGNHGSEWLLANVAVVAVAGDELFCSAAGVSMTSVCCRCPSFRSKAQL